MTKIKRIFSLKIPRKIPQERSHSYNIKFSENTQEKQATESLESLSKDLFLSERLIGVCFLSYWEYVSYLLGVCFLSIGSMFPIYWEYVFIYFDILPCTLW